MTRPGASWRWWVPIFALGLWSLAPGVVAQGRAVDGYVQRLGTERVAQMAALLSDCGGVYMGFSQATALAAPQLAGDYREMQNGAMVAAAYLLYREHGMRTGERRAFESFIPAVKARAEAKAAEVMQLFAANELEAAKLPLGECARLEDLQSFLVRQWRAEMQPSE